MASNAETAWVRACVAHALRGEADTDTDGAGAGPGTVAGTGTRTLTGAADTAAVWSLLTPAQRAGHAPLPDPLPAAQSLTDRLAPRLGNLPAAHRRALLIASVSISDRTEVLAAASGLTLDGLFDGTFDGLVSFVSRRYRLSDPRVRIVAHATANVAERTDAHTRLAAALAESSPYEAAWHRSLAALGGLPDVVPRLLGLSRRALRRGDSVFAYRVAREAASQSEPGRLRTIAQLRAGLSALHSGHAREAREWLGAVLRSGDVMLEASALAAFIFSVGAADGHVPHADLDRLEARWRAETGRGLTPAYGRGIVLGLATAAALHAERDDAASARAFGERARELTRQMGSTDAASAGPANDIVSGVWVWLAACGVAGSGAAGSAEAGWSEAGWSEAPARSSDPTVAAGLSLVDAFSALSRRGAAGARDAAHALADSILSLAPLDREAARDGGTRGSATPLVEAHLRVAHWIVEQAGNESTPHTAVSDAPPRRGPVSDPGDPLLSRLPLHLPFGGTFVRQLDASAPIERTGDDATPSVLHLPRRVGLAGRPGPTPEHPTRFDDTSPHASRSGGRAVAGAQPLDEAGETAHPLATVQRLFPDDEPAWLAALTAREAEVARLVVGGASNREIAGRMHLSVRTVEVHLGRVFQKLNVHSRTQLSLLVHRGGYVETRS
ncbi:helix-turn-helix transcriptional regulator [Leifsonia sp. ALI-44-B]|uniref:helix-turn-helix domain-containing protein n=1 Tax=Leifsonia sp. ALI-44-B TaxID=1933776 RepID=UPI0009F91196|nr:helix-turn-helix transcriptional regulator [Leifsonia sp. ALI-44-B]